MGTLVLSGATSGSTTLQPTDATTQTLTLPGQAGNLAVYQSVFGLKNRIINGAMVIDQRNAGASVTPAANVYTYTVDRWSAYCNQASKFTVQQSSTAPAGFINSLLVTSSSAYSVTSTDIFVIDQMIEGLNCTDLGWGTANAKTVTLSFQVYSSLTGTFGGSIQNSAQNRSYPFSYTISSANTWTSISVTIAGDTAGTWLTTNGIGMRVYFGLGCGSVQSGTAGTWAGTSYYSATGATSVVGTNGATFYITGVQLEVGNTATTFDYRMYGTELVLCQRYLPAFNASGSTIGSIGTGGFYDTTHAAIGVPFPVLTRVPPTGLTVSNATDFQVDGVTSASCSAVTFSNASNTMAGVNITYNTTTSSGSFGRMRYNTGTAQLLFTGCEL